MGRCFIALERGEVHNPDDPAIPAISLRFLRAGGGHADRAVLVASGCDAGAEVVLLHRFSARAVEPRSNLQIVSNGIEE